MPLLYLIRHGQASFGSDHYDKLSDLGQQQSRLVGAHLQNISVRFDAVYRGKLQRQRSTLQALSEGYDTANHALPTANVDDAFDEYDADKLFRTYLPGVLKEDAELAKAQDRIKTDRALFQAAFSSVMRAWLQSRPHTEVGVETWGDFLERVENGLHAIIAEQPRTAKVAVITSGGPIAVAMRSALHLSDEQTVQINYGIYNTSITRIRMGHSGRRLMGFNDIAHLELPRRPNLITFR